MSKAGEMLGMSTSSIMPVKNYSSELDSNTDTLLLTAVDLMLEYANLYFLDQASEGPKKIRFKSRAPHCRIHLHSWAKVVVPIYVS